MENNYISKAESLKRKYILKRENIRGNVCLFTLTRKLSKLDVSFYKKATNLEKKDLKFGDIKQLKKLKEMIVDNFQDFSGEELPKIIPRSRRKKMIVILSDAKVNAIKEYFNTGILNNAGLLAAEKLSEQEYYERHFDMAVLCHKEILKVDEKKARIFAEEELSIFGDSEIIDGFSDKKVEEVTAFLEVAVYSKGTA